ncbi:MAG: FKBP-type peptidyl-prolyl cis-trans isomerase [Alloprevotella sp.]
MLKLRTLALCSLALLMAGTAAALPRKKKKPAQTADNTLVNPVRPVPADTFSYAFGVAQAKGLRNYLLQRENVDSAYIDVAFQAMNTPMSAEESKKIMALAAGLKIAEMNRNMLDGLNKQATGKSDTVYVNLSELGRGLIEGNRPEGASLSPDSANALLDRQQNFIQNELRIAGQKFLIANRKAEGVKETASGLQYKVLTAGNGALATDSSEVEVHYEGRLIDGTVFDSSYKRGKPSSFKAKQVIKGWTEALQMMPEGSVWELYIPYQLAYGERGNQNIPPFAPLIFKVEVIKVKSNPKP